MFIVSVYVYVFVLYLYTYIRTTNSKSIFLYTIQKFDFHFLFWNLNLGIDKLFLMWYIQFRNWKSKFDFEKEIWNLEIKLRNGNDRPTSPLMAIKEFCMECCGWERSAVKSCSAFQCPLFEFRFGKNTYNKRTLTDEQRQELAERAKRARESKKDIWKINQILRDNSSANNLYSLNYRMKLELFS